MIVDSVGPFRPERLFILFTLFLKLVFLKLKLFNPPRVNLNSESQTTTLLKSNCSRRAALLHVS